MLLRTGREMSWGIWQLHDSVRPKEGSSCEVLWYAVAIMSTGRTTSPRLTIQTNSTITQLLKTLMRATNHLLQTIHCCLLHKELCLLVTLHTKNSCLPLNVPAKRKVSMRTRKQSRLVWSNETGSFRDVNQEVWVPESVQERLPSNPLRQLWKIWALKFFVQIKTSTMATNTMPK